MKDPLQASAHAGSGILKLNSTQCRKGDAAEIHSPAACPTGNADGASATSDNTPVRGLAGRFLWSVADYGGGRALRSLRQFMQRECWVWPGLAFTP